MDESSELSSIPWWIWLVGSGAMLGVIVIFALKYERPDNERYRPFRKEHSDGRRSRRRRLRSRSHDRD